MYNKEVMEIDFPKIKKSVEPNNKSKFSQTLFEFFWSFYGSDTVIDLSILFGVNNVLKNEELKKIKWCLQNRGWFLVKFPEEHSKQIVTSSDDISKELIKYFNFMNHKSRKQTSKNEFKLENVSNSEFGFSNFKDYKSVFRLFTNDMLKLFKNDYQFYLYKDMKILSDIMDQISFKFIKNTQSIWYPTLSKQSTIRPQLQQQLSNLTLFDKNISFGMINFVYYKNNKQTNDKKYKMLKNNLNVKEHIDPGLFSISFIQDNIGLQMFDKYDKKWIQIPIYKNGTYGVLWTGQYASEVTDFDINTGIHRVTYNDKKPRFTGWYEACVYQQISRKVFQQMQKTQS